MITLDSVPRYPISNNIVMRKEVEQLALMGAMPDEADERITAALVSSSFRRLLYMG